MPRKRRKRPPSLRPLQFGVVSAFGDRTLVRLYTRSPGEPDGRRLIAVVIGSRKLVDAALKLAVDQQLPQAAIEAGIAKLAVAEGLTLGRIDALRAPEAHHA